MWERSPGIRRLGKEQVMTVEALITIPSSGIPMSQNKVPSTVSSKPHIYHYPTRNMGFLRGFLSAQVEKAISLYIHITQLRQIDPGASYKRKTGSENVAIPKRATLIANRLQLRRVGT
jgi:hypothetical protein